MAQPRKLQKIIVNLEHDRWHGFATETVWAEQLGPREYKLRSVPFYAYGLAFGDIVATTPEDCHPVVDRVVMHGGHSTYRVFLDTATVLADERFRKYWAPLESAGCTFERASARLLAVDVPGHADLRQVYALLERGEKEGAWEFEEGHAAV